MTSKRFDGGVGVVTGVPGVLVLASGLPPAGGDTAALALVGLAGVLAVAFVVVNYASFVPGASGSASG